MIRASLLAAGLALSTVGCHSAATRHPVVGPDVNAVFAATHEADDPAEHFTTDVASTSADATPPPWIADNLDGHGGTLTAAAAVRDPTADGKGMIVAFWHNATFVGLAQNFEVLAVSDVRATAPRQFTVVYLNYRDSDPLCCPSGNPRLVSIAYDWDGRRFVPDKPLPRGTYRPPPTLVVPPPPG